MNAPAKFRPIAARHKPDRITVYVGAQYNDLPLDAAMNLFIQLGDALEVPVSEKLRYQAWVASLRNIPTPGEVMDLFRVGRSTAHRWISEERTKRSKAGA